MEFKHIPVLLSEAVEGLNIKKNGIYVDGTLGGGGHSFAIAEQLTSGGRLIGFDQDKEALAAAKERLKVFSDRVEFVHSSFLYMPSELKKLGIDKVDGILLDIGVSSYQLDEAKRGFSYRFDAPLDMRMDQRKNVTAASILESMSERELAGIFKRYGEERFADRIAARIVKEREKAPIETTFQLNEIIADSIPAKFKKTGHPSKRTFQALRIVVNGELEVLEKSIPEMIDLLGEKGRLCVITFHSLEDRIVKEEFKKAQTPCECPPDFPICVCGKKSKGRVITRKALVASKEELENNPRAASAKLRIFERAI